jgi:hypothetical protein
MRDDEKPFSPLSPQTEYTEIPAHYENPDIAHVMARVRFMNEFIDAVEQLEDLQRVYDEVFELYKQKLQEFLAPYALDLALSLVALEDSLKPDEAEEVPHE